MKIILSAATAAIALSGVAFAQQDTLTMTGTQPLISEVSFTDTSHDFNSLSDRQEQITTFTTQDNSGNAYTVAIEQPATDVNGEYRLMKVGGANSGAAFSIPFSLRLQEIGNDSGCADLAGFSRQFRSVAISTINACTYEVEVDFASASAREAGNYQAVLKLIKN